MCEEACSNFVRSSEVNLVLPCFSEVCVCFLKCNWLLLLMKIKEEVGLYQAWWYSWFLTFHFCWAEWQPRQSGLEWWQIQVWDGLCLVRNRRYAGRVGHKVLSIAAQLSLESVLTTINLLLVMTWEKEKKCSISDASLKLRHWRNHRWSVLNEKKNGTTTLLTCWCPYCW